MIFFLFFLGLLVGSFLNVVIFRIERGESFVGGRSHCLQCKHTLAWFENIPLLSFLWLKGKCRDCEVSLSWQYPLVEVITALLFTSSFFILRTYQSQEPWLQLTIASLLLLTLCFAILITVYDLRFSLIPNTFLWGLNVSTFFFLALHYFFQIPGSNFFPPEVSSSLFGALIAGGFFYLLVFISRETWMGWGDVWLGIWAGMIVGIELIQIFITLSFSLGAFVGLTFLYQKKKTLKAEIPFAPYILASGFIILFAMYSAPEFLRFLSPWLPGTIE